MNRLDAVGEAVENEREPVVLIRAGSERAGRHRYPVVPRTNLDGHDVAGSGVEHAEHGKLEVVHAFVRKVETGADTAEYEAHDCPEPRLRRNRDNDLVVHGRWGSGVEHVGFSHDHLDWTTVGELMDFSVAVEAREECVIVRVSGEFDMARVAEVEAALASATDAQHVVLDLSGCTFLDSSGVRVITATVRTADRVSLVAADPSVVRVLELTAVDSVVSIHPSLDAAL